MSPNTVLTPKPISTRGRPVSCTCIRCSYTPSMHQHIQQLGSCPETKQNKQGIGNIPRRGGFGCFPPKIGFDNVKSAIRPPENITLF